MDFSILGPVEAVGTEGALPLGGPRQRALLAFLLVNANRAVAADRLVDELWDAPPGDAHAALQNQVSRLRKVLGDRLVTKAPGYLLRVEDGELDLDRFRTLVAAAGSASEVSERSRLLREADQLFRGTPFAEIDAPFAAAEAAALEELRLAAVEARVDADLERGRQAELVPELASLVARHPLRERLRGQHILALYRCGRQAEALDAYRATRAMLDEQLGLEPSPALRELERAILRHDPTLAQDRIDEASPVVLVSPVAAGRRRRPLAVAVGALALAGAGAAAAMLMRDTPAPRTAAKVVAHKAPRRHVVAPRTHEAPAVRRTKPKAKAKLHVAHTRPVTVVEIVRQKTSPAVTHGATTVKPVTVPAPAPTRTRPTTTPKAPANVTPTVTTVADPTIPASWRTLTDDFSGSTPNWAMWGESTDGTGASWVQQSGRLELTLDASGQTGGQYNMLSIGFASRCRFPGDFDARVDYALLNWNPPAGARVQLSAWTPNPPYADTARASNQYGDMYDGDDGGAYQGFPTSDTHGTIRVARTGTTASSYYLQNGKWVLLQTGAAPGDVMLGLQLFAMSTEWTHKTVRAAFDNFRVDAAGVTC